MSFKTLHVSYPFICLITLLSFFFFSMCFFTFFFFSFLGIHVFFVYYLHRLFFFYELCSSFDLMSFSYDPNRLHIFFFTFSFFSFVLLFLFFHSLFFFVLFFLFIIFLFLTRTKLGYDTFFIFFFIILHFSISIRVIMSFLDKREETLLYHVIFKFYSLPS